MEVRPFERIELKASEKKKDGASVQKSQAVRVLGGFGGRECCSDSPE
jgi:hypothetical protein